MLLAWFLYIFSNFVEKWNTVFLYKHCISLYSVIIFMWIEYSKWDSINNYLVNSNTYHLFNSFIWISNNFIKSVKYYYKNYYKLYFRIFTIIKFWLQNIFILLLIIFWKFKSIFFLISENKTSYIGIVVDYVLESLSLECNWKKSDAIYNKLLILFIKNYK